jgi:hypothetical protein
LPSFSFFISPPADLAASNVSVGNLGILPIAYLPSGVNEAGNGPPPTPGDPRYWR